MSKKGTKEVKEQIKEESGVDEATGDASAQDLGAELEGAREQLKVSEEKVLRLAADFDNTRKRLEREKETLAKFAEENILKELLPCIDNLERAIVQGREVAEATGFLEGVELTLKGLLDTLDKFGVKSINSVGEVFDPNLHEALAMEESSEQPANTVLKEFQKGYHYKDRLLRAAKVIVAKNSGPETP